MIYLTDTMFRTIKNNIFFTRPQKGPKKAACVLQCSEQRLWAGHRTPKNGDKTQKKTRQTHTLESGITGARAGM
jgi:hypothetical protein